MTCATQVLQGFFEQPVLATKVPVGEGWLHELKHDGFGIIAHKHGERVHLWSRNGRDEGPTPLNEQHDQDHRYGGDDGEVGPGHRRAAQKEAAPDGSPSAAKLGALVAVCDRDRARDLCRGRREWVLSEAAKDLLDRAAYTSIEVKTASSPWTVPLPAGA